MMTIHRTITFLNLILITLIAYLGVNLFYRVISTEAPEVSESMTEVSPETAQAGVQTQTAGTYTVIAERDLFHTKTAVPTATTDPTHAIDGLIETQLRLRLWGTVSGDPVTAYAVIEDMQSNQQDLYRVGDEIQRATLKMILREKVVITVAGRDEVLNMEEAASGGGSVAMSEHSGALSEEPPPEAIPVGLDESSAMEEPMVERAQRVSLNRTIVDSAIRDVTRLMSEITITPHTEGEASGLAVTNIRPNSIFRRMGLRNGDILVGIDGQEIQSVDDAMRLYEGLRSSSDLRVQINRRGQQRTIDYNIR